MMTDGRTRQRVGRLVVLGAIVLLIVLAVLLIHVAFMGSAHHDGSGCATCIAVVAAGLVLLLGALARAQAGQYSFLGHLAPMQPLAAIASGRHPPPRGVVLRL